MRHAPLFGTVVLIAACGVVSLGVACGAPPERAHEPNEAANGRGPRYLAIGDSFTIGTGSGVESAFPSRLATRWRDARCSVEVRNIAVDGYTTDDVIAEELPVVAMFRPTFITVAIGANDIVRGSSEDEYRTNVHRILVAAMAKGARVVVIPQPDWSLSPGAASLGDRTAIASSIQRFNAILASEAKANGATWVDLSPLMQQQARDHMLASDGLHPSATAYAAWADALAKAVPSPCL